MTTLATLCTGIGGFDAGFEDAGLDTVFQCEADKDCLRVLAHHWPAIERTADVNGTDTEDALRRLRPDVIAFGSPCQDLSVAGKRGGLAAERSGLFFRCVELAFACEAPWVVFENVPGLFSSHGGADFASVLEAFTGVRPAVPQDGWRNHGVCIGPLYSVAWAVLDAQWFGVAQRRRRVFVVASLGDRAGPYEILSLAQSCAGDTPPSREAGTGVAKCLATGTNGARFDGESEEFIVNALDAHMGMGGPDDNAAQANHLVTHALRSEGADASEDGTGRGTPLAVVAFNWQAAGKQTTLGCDEEKTSALHVGQTPAVAFQRKHYMRDEQGGSPSEVCPTLTSAQAERSDGEVLVYNPHRTLQADGSVAEGFKPDSSTDALHGPTGNKEPLVFQTRVARCGRGAPEAVAPALTSCEGGTHADSKPHVFGGGTAVRRLTPLECCRLQGFADDWLELTPPLSDSAKYRLLGNAVCVNVARWIGRQLLRAIESEGV